MKWSHPSESIPKEKNLPSTPIDQTIVDVSLNHRQQLPEEFNDDFNLNSKSLDRKNYKNLSLSSVSSNDNVQYNNNDDSAFIKEPTSLRQKRQRAAPTLDLNASTPSTVSTISNDSIIDGNQSTSPSSQIVGHVINLPKNKIKLDNEPNHNASSIMTQMNKMNLSNNPNRKSRQTVISSISPTKSTNASPIESKIQLLNFDASHSPTSTTSTLRLNNSDLVTLKQLGSGNSGTVSKILHLPSQKIMAKKIIHVDSKSVIQTQIIRELRILHECQSPFIIEFFGAFLNNNNTIVICMEYCNCGSLDKILPLCENRQFPNFVLKKLSYSILSGLTYLYDTHKIIHRDIKPNNVLMTHRGEFKLCDFGVSRELTNSLAMADTFVGTSMYMSPERIQGMKYGVKSDVWSMGLMLIELASGLPVWIDEDDINNQDSNKSFKGPEGILDLLQRIVNEDAPTLTNKINIVTDEPYESDLCEFIDSCLIKNDTLRKSPWQLLQNNKNGFLKGVENGVFNKEHKLWAKKIRKLNKESK